MSNTEIEDFEASSVKMGVEGLAMLRHAFIDTMDKDKNYTAIFDDFVDNVTNRKILLDHIFVSPSLFWKSNGDRNAEGLIEHEIFDQNCDQGHGRQAHPSDHRPQTVTLDV